MESNVLKIKEIFKDKLVDKLIDLYKSVNEKYKDKYIHEDYYYNDYIDSVFNKLISLNADIHSLCAFLLFELDLLENLNVEAEYSLDTYNILIALNRIKQVKEKTNNNINNLDYRKILIALAKDYRVIVIKLVMQEVLILSIKDINSEYSINVANESEEVFAPIAHRLGISSIKTNLENKSLYILHNEDYIYIENMLKQTKEERQKCIDMMIDDLIKILNTHNIPYISIKGRPKSIYSIYNKISKKNLSFNSLYDLLGLRVITETEVNCYEILGYIHAIYKPISGRFKDYIAVPKPNMYQSLHTAVIANDGHKYEIQIRTKKMDEWAESGIASHWRYKEGSKTGDAVVEEKLHLFSDIVTSNNSENNLEDITKEVFESKIYVMSPMGKVIELPIGSCPIDFAYRIHTKVGTGCIGAKVNGNIVPLNTLLQTGDIVEIKTSKLHTLPSKGWLHFVKTHNARDNIRKALQKAENEDSKDDLISKGKSLLEEKIRDTKLNDGRIDEIISDASFLQQFGASKLNELYLAIGARNVNVLTVLDKIRIRKNIDNKSNFEFRSRAIKKTNNSGIVINGIDNIKVELSKCCCPIPGDEIVGYITRGQGIKVHCKNCQTLKSLEPRLIDVEWDSSVVNNIEHQANLIVVAEDRNNLLVEIINALSALKITVNQINAIAHKSNMNATIEISLMVKNSEQLDSVINTLKRVNNVFDVNRLENM